MAHVATAPLVIAKNDEGGDVYVYQGGVLPPDQDEAWLAQMVAEGLVAEVSDEAEAATRPARNAGRDPWLAYALANGVPEEEASGLSRDELRDLLS
jgi:hypothetical protein